jgi:peptidoglycan/LPS O-acetylase OafA/YrhL
MVKGSLKLEGLNVVRFFAFFWVFCTHTLPTKTDSHNLIIRFFAFLNSNGYLGVNLFFVLSSFLLTYLGLSEKKGTNNFSIRNFLIRRSLRIFPLYYLVIAFSFLVLPVIARFASISLTLPGNFWYFVFFLSNYDHSNFIFALKFLWSVAIEEQFYWSWALLLLIFQKNFLLVTALLFFIYCATFFVLQPMGLKAPSDSITYLSNFSTGGLFAILFFYFKQYVKLLPFSVILLIISGVGWFFLGDKNYYMVQLIISLFFASILIFSIAVCDFSFVKRNFIYKFFDNLGIYTYGLYVYSGFVITLINFTVTHYDISLNRFIIFLLELGTIIMIAITSYKFYEVKFLKYSNRFKWKSTDGAH